MLRRLATCFGQITGASMCQPPFPLLPPGPLVLSSRASIWILPHKSVVSSPSFKSHLICHLPQKAFPDPSPEGMCSFPIACTYDTFITLHYNNLCACLSSYIHPSLENFKGSNLISFINVSEELGVRTGMPQMLDFSQCTPGTKLLSAFRGCELDSAVRQLRP